MSNPVERSGRDGFDPVVVHGHAPGDDVTSIAAALSTAITSALAERTPSEHGEPSSGSGADTSLRRWRLDRAAALALVPEQATAPRSRRLP